MDIFQPVSMTKEMASNLQLSTFHTLIVIYQPFPRLELFIPQLVCYAQPCSLYSKLFCDTVFWVL